MDRDSTERLLLGVILTAWAARPSRQEFAPMFAGLRVPTDASSDADGAFTTA
jgi:hypothetical protein